MQRSHIVRPAAMFWGLTVFMPVGVTYLSALLLMVALLAAGGWRERAVRLRGNPMWWPVMAYVVWTLVILAIGPHYPETASNLVHGLRIAATVLMALALTREEAVWAVRGFWIMGLVNIVMIALYYTVGFPMLEPWRGVLILIGNKSISNALLFTIMAATATVYGLKALTGHRPWRALAAFALVPAVMAIITFTLPSRTSLLALLLVIPAACVHQWRRQLKVLAVVMMVGGAIAIGVLWNSPVVQQKFAVGIQEIEAAQAGEISEASWVVRYYMYRDTARMIIDRPFDGWGIGGWTEQWHLRGPKLLDYKNMPHNDFLWMGAQGGVPGALSLLVIVLASVWIAWRRDDLAGRQAFVATLVLLIATSVNSALRDAQIGLALLWVAMVYLRLAQEPGDSWRGLLPSLRRS
ncbi:O-antigen ligase family protein [Variovorax saccharolyticus]|uniref:O-antigen ligase family protein n=1 Tax=Variovorax saccharolyticus TaxID=3053516 RepID=UPI00257826FB|nr:MULTISPECIES: O-antigen ligase family protein [unclassified Variovorax]MDM0017191.1 O-antigen ligase family protein [Variovorax sp. J22R187]MDM0030235.1 O-antigen ligase family protein [Variovorax sp. J31P216]